MCCTWFERFSHLSGPIVVMMKVLLYSIFNKPYVTNESLIATKLNSKLKKKSDGAIKGRTIACCAWTITEYAIKLEQHV